MEAAQEKKEPREETISRDIETLSLFHKRAESRKSGEEEHFEKGNGDRCVLSANRKWEKTLRLTG